MINFKFLFCALLFCSLAIAQKSGSISGVITDKDFNNEPLAYASVGIKDSTIGMITDENGNFNLKVDEGNHVLVISYMGYETAEIPVTIKSNETVRINQTLSSNSVKVEDVVITTSVNKQKEASLLIEQQKAIGIQSNIGAQELSRKGVSDVATAVTKTTGISKQEETGAIYVRGLGDRYNATSMNGLPIPSNNPEKKNIDLSLFTTDIVEYISIDKVYHPKMFGDFAGGNVDIISKDFKGKDLFEIEIGVSANTNAIGENEFYLQQGWNEMGFSKTEIPSDPLNSFGFENSLKPQKQVPFSGNIGLRFGKSFDIGQEGRLSFFATAGFENGYTYREGINQSVSAQGAKLKSFEQKKYAYNTNTTGMFNTTYKINANHKLSYNFLFVNSSSQTNDEYTGFLRDIAENDNGFIRRGTYEQNQLMVNQLLGSHTLSNRFRLNWGASFNTIESKMPDRTQNTLWFNETQGGYVFAVNSTTDNHRYFQNLKEDEIAVNTAVDYLFNADESENYKSKLTIGYQGKVKNRDFEATQFNFRIAGSQSNTVLDPNNLNLFLNQNNFQNGHFSIETFSGNLEPQVYEGEQIVHAGFVNLEYQMGEKWTTSIGVRAEQIAQNVSWKTQLDNIGNENKLENNTILPSLILKYKINEKQNLRLAASKTYTLPQFKERAYFVYEDVTEVKVGNPDLYASDDYNLDIKWEIFPKEQEIISFTAFGKYIQNPINEVTLASSTNDISYINTGDKGYVFGAEFEIRKQLWQLGSNNEDKLSFGFNVSYMKTSQDLDSDKVRNETNYNINLTDSKAGFTGASDLLANTDLSFFKKFRNDASVMATFAYSYFSDRLYALGTETKGNLVDKGLGSLDFVLKSKLNKNLGLNFSAKNLLDPRYNRVQENTNEDITVLSYKKGINISLGLQYSF